jgi:predicted nucleotidyltransferase
MKPDHKKHQQQLLKKIVPLSKKDYWILSRNAVPFGSQVFGGATKESDLDLIVKGYKKNTSFDHIHGHLNGVYLDDYGQDNDFRSVYHRTPDGHLVNFICMENQEAYRKWVRATATMNNLIKIDPLICRRVKDKRLRISLFEALKDVAQKIPPHLATPKAPEYDDDVPF